MATNVSPNNNYGEYVITGEVDVASGTTGPTAIRGDGMTVARGGVGTIVVTLKGSQNVKLGELLQRHVSFAGSTAPTTALGCRVHTVTQNTNDDIIITLKTTATAGGSGADTDGGAAVTLSFYVSFRFLKMGNPL